MNVVALALASIRSRPLLSGLCVTAMAAGIAILLSILLLFSSVESGLKRNARGIDIVVGAKGSPLQLVLSSVYHADIPNGNIEAEDMEKIMDDPSVRRVIPLAFGDNHNGFRIVGATPDYIGLYGAEFAKGEMYHAEFEAVAGAMTGLKTGDKFTASHGFDTGEDDHGHEDHPYTVSGVLKPTGTVLDRLIVTTLTGVQEIHRHGHEHEEEGHGGEITALLVKVKSPVAIMNLPNRINSATNLLAVSPSHVMARTMQSSGIGRDALELTGYVFLLLACAMILSVLAAGMKERAYDLAVMRVLGASRLKILATTASESVILAFGGALAGIILAHLLAYAMTLSFPILQSVVTPSALLAPSWFDALFLAIGMLTGILASIVPCLLALRADMAGLLAQAR
jgi:putative ABC transport system permease protein